MPLLEVRVHAFLAEQEATLHFQETATGALKKKKETRSY